MREMLVNRHLIAALVASAAFAVAAPIPLSADEPSSEPAPVALTVVALAPSSPALDAQAQSSPAPDASTQPATATELTQLIRPLPPLLPPPVIAQPAPPAYYYYPAPPFFQPAPPVVQRAPVRRVVRRAPAPTAAPLLRVARSELVAPRRVALFGVGFGF